MKKTQPNPFLVFTLFLILFTIIITPDLFAQQPYGTVKGKVVTADKNAADNIAIGLMGTRYGTSTNGNGDFVFKAPAGAYTLIISYIGVETVEVPVTVLPDQTVDVPLITVKASMAQLSEVNIIASRANRFTRKISTDVGKIPLSNLENAQSYATITNELLKEQQLYTVDDALRNAPGVQKMWDATGRAGDGGGYFTLRGFPTQTRLRDGVAGLVTSSIDAVNIDKIEVIKGPSATLFGSALTSFGGLVNRVTKKPYDTLGIEIGQAAGNYDLSRTSLDLNTPLSKDKNVLFRLNSAYNYEGSFQNYGKSRSFAAAPSLSVKVSEKLSFLAQAELFYGRSSAKPFFFFYSTPSQMGISKVSQLNINYNQAYSNDNVTQYSRSANYFAQANYKFSDKLTSQTLFTSSNSFSNGASPYYYLVTDAVANSFGAPDIAGDNNYILRYDQSTRNSKLNTTEIQENLNGDFNIGALRNRFVLGLDLQHVNSNQVFFGNFYGVAPINSSTFDYGAFNKQLVDATNAANPLTAANTYTYIYKTDTYSAYVSDVLNITDQLIASAGGRLDHYENKGTYNFDHVQQTRPFNQTAFSPKFGLIYQPVKDQLSFFANYQNGFVNPGVFTNGNNEPVVAKLQNANQVEGGFKLALFNGKLNGTISYYRINLTNTLRAIPNSPVYGQVQDGTQTSKGFETEIIANPFSGINIVAGFSYNDSKYTRADSDVIGRRPNTAGSPYLANLYISYRLPQNVVKGLGVGIGGNYASDNKIINSNSQGTFSLPSYTLFNGSLFFDRSKYRLGLSANNITNKHYYTGYTTVNPQKLRQFVLSASYKL
ncbi:TonB-dependent receptor [Mucilaginibacter xinganensis]|uniref:TonB-dependent siderophore receptor n=1 Tax=Mucilaginibacter xinganensis TaxID=1234841 RepID=A0A223P0F5_9SPHI|nr:TonB-dependent receptor [Mucilaginibacter xinganensis]ASU35587.1 TonB-dependent siderophore receptor [Mucilaginibacter xinganensis]